MTIAYTTGQITLTNGSAVVTGIGTAWQISLIAGGLIAAEADGNPLPIESVNSDTSITAAIEWKGATGTYGYALVRDTAYLQQLNLNSATLARLIAELEAGTIFKYDASGDLSGRSAYDDRAKDFSYLVVIGVTTPELYVKSSAASGAWAGPFSYGTGPKGDTGPTGPAGIANPRGTYASGTAYLKNDVVLYNGSSFVALQATTGNAPPTLPTTANAYWQLTAIKGTDGNGTGDLVGPNGVTDGNVAVFDGVTGKLLKQQTKTQFKTWLATTALDVSFSNGVANLPGNPTTVQAAIEAIGNSGGKNDALFALEIADLKGQRMGMVGGVADSFDDTTGIEPSASTNYSYNAANDWFLPIANTTAFGAQGSTVDYSAATFVDLTNVLVPNSTVTGIGAYLASAKTVEMKIFRRNSPGNFDVILSQALSHPGGGYADATLASPYVVPATGTYVIGIYIAAGVNTNRASGVLRAFSNGNASGNGVTMSESASNVDLPPLRVVNGSANMTLVSVNYTVPTAPSTARVAVQLADSLTLVPNTDFMMEVTRDGGNTWTAVSLALSMPSFGGVKMYEGTASLYGQPTGTAMSWRFKTLTNKNIIASGVVLQQS